MSRANKHLLKVDNMKKRAATVYKKYMHRMNTGICLLATVVLAAAVASVALAQADKVIPIKQAKLIIEHNATDKDTGFQGFIDSKGWQRLEVTGPKGVVLSFEGRGKLGSLGLTELFFETVEPKNKEVSIGGMLDMLPEGKYMIKGSAIENTNSEGWIAGTAWLTHNIPDGPVLLTPVDDVTVPTDDLVMSWSPVTQTIKRTQVNIIAYQLIIEKDEESPPHMIGKRGLSMYLPTSTTKITVPKGFLEPGASYKWEVLAIEESGNQTLSSSEFKTW